MEKVMKNRRCCFLGHRKIKETPELIETLFANVKNLIEREEVVDFLFGSKSEFNDLCYDVVTKLKEKYPHVRRVYIRASFADIDKEYENYLLEHYEKTYFPEKLRGAGKASYVERNQEMIDNSKFCIVYYDENYLPPKRKTKRELTGYQPKSGTKVAYNYAVCKKRNIINVFRDEK